MPSTPVNSTYPSAVSALVLMPSSIRVNSSSHGRRKMNNRIGEISVRQSMGPAARFASAVADCVTSAGEHNGHQTAPTLTVT